MSTQRGVLLWSAFLLITTPVWAVSEAKPCAPEPTDMNVAYGDVMSGTDCFVSPNGDADLFRFSGQANDLVRIVGLMITEGYPNNLQLELLDPNGSSIAVQYSNSGLGVYAAVIQMRLPLTGAYTLVMRESGNDAVQHYNLMLDRLDPVAQTQLRQHMSDVCLHRCFAEEQFGCYFCIGHSASHQEQYFALAIGERAEGGRWCLVNRGQAACEAVEQPSRHARSNDRIACRHQADRSDEVVGGHVPDRDHLRPA